MEKLDSRQCKLNPLPYTESNCAVSLNLYIAASRSASRLLKCCLHWGNAAQVLLVRLFLLTLPSITAQDHQHALLHPKHHGYTSENVSIPVKITEKSGWKRPPRSSPTLFYVDKLGVYLEPDMFVICKPLKQLSWWIILRLQQEKKKIKLCYLLNCFRHCNTQEEWMKLSREALHEFFPIKKAGRQSQRAPKELLDEEISVQTSLHMKEKPLKNAVKNPLWISGWKLCLWIKPLLRIASDTKNWKPLATLKCCTTAP